ncbi:DNA topoisomerase (ATP-hydrolyzing) subunit A [Pseudidiomarina sp. 1APR75-15]|uniref:DNA gyrase subunit A n=1 Tax=Pseudidiomarina terrestris TaxID=2820060 RepID=A0ABT8MF02_9GAMM|nr:MULTISPECIES: DNA topoisomerase (ATP-hydrolyzing) subunit A [unclassified Pseudidiomarina]MDN7127289.1 DNA topoisomerase (ATP-hydrolyzing) subunit A [Pseudidiomarina sp. 1APR75-33.1]MDN7128479.1 DNA topoisomerase (ATP-hydrolyzing) subunit A [Pseudidiomarina sp. 1APR75-15]MDN7138668.1 DNA topoisomerase (ATP-hydrolyzing) subunit A [Pseudidiomarina sp. 1ASP75-14]MEA3586957.1 DNA topoisomerase (ATP-hydrolyzing) subunit A [Pseudidiomarina sp. 1APP75-27a]
MSDLAREVVPVNIEDELKSSYLDYAMSVIVGRALPDVRDGLKPVHRRVLFAMNELRNDFNKPYKKSARIVGDVIGKYHPHGDSAVYDTIVRMAQPFSLRYMLVDGQGNFGSVDGDSAAAMRYTEIRMAKIASELLSDLDKETVDFVPNYDGTEQIPDVLPTRVPNLLVNGSSGIAVGMATNIPPHNLGEVIDGCLAMIENPDITTDELMEFIPGPDFPTAASISGRAGIVEAYRTGRGRIHLRAKAEIETDSNGREAIIVNEIPYQVNKARLIEKIAELVKEKRLEGISGLRDESDKDGMRIVIELKRGEVGEVVLNHLYANTQMQVVFGINMVALDKNQPRLFNLRDMIDCFILHRREVVTRRSVYELRKARERAHILEGLAIALANIDDVIELIRRSQTAAEAKAGLVSRAWILGDVANMLERAGVDAARPDHLAPEYGIRDGQYHLTEEQAQAILDLRLHKLTGLEHEKILEEYKNLLSQIEELLLILNNSARLMEVIREELEKIKLDYGDPRRTEITAAAHDISMEDLINEEDVVVTLSHHGYVKYQPLTEYEAQRRGGKGKAATKMKDEDFIERLWVANTHDTILCFSTRGRIYWMKVYQLPLASRASRGRPIVNLLPLEADERITAILPTRDYPDDKFILMATKNGTVKKTPMVDYSRPRSGGIIALNLNDGDELIGVDMTSAGDEVMLFSDAGKVVRFSEDQVRSMGRTATGVRGIRLEEGQRVVSLIVPRTIEEEVPTILTVTENGFGKRTPITDYPAKSRATKGVVSIKVSERNGAVVGAMEVVDANQIMLISNKGTLVRTRVSEVSTVGRNTQGVRLIRTGADEKVVGMQRIDELDEDELDDIELDVEDTAENAGEDATQTPADDSNEE